MKYWEVTECLLEKSKFIILNVTEILKITLEEGLNIVVGDNEAGEINNTRSYKFGTDRNY